MHVEIRDANPGDAPVIVEFNRLLALESEAKVLHRETLERGVRAILADRALGRYFVAESAGSIVGQLMMTYEWSDWRNGWIWWLQSVYVEREHRRRGVFRRLFAHVVTLCERDPGIVGLRLYVEDGNAAAQETYTRLGMARAGYHVLERIWRGGVARVEDAGERG